MTEALARAIYEAWRLHGRPAPEYPVDWDHLRDADVGNYLAIATEVLASGAIPAPLWPENGMIEVIHANGGYRWRVQSQQGDSVVLSPVVTDAAHARRDAELHYPGRRVIMPVHG